jgi:DNA-binding response OmpR family regulator
MYTILVVDDDQDLVESLDFALSHSNYKVVQAKNGAEGVTLAFDLKPDLILLDIMMPNLNGLTACRGIKSMEETKNIPIIMLTAKGEIEDIKSAFKVGTDDYVVKPFIMDQLLEKIGKLLEQRSGEKRVSDE